MSYITTLNWTTIVDKINEAEESIHIALPSIDEELSECLITLQPNKNVTIKVCVDNSEDAIRNGYGETQGIEKLLQAKIEVKQLKGNRVSFILIDKKGYFIFPESRIFSADPTGPNAIAVDPYTVHKLIADFFPPEDELDKKQLVKNLEAVKIIHDEDVEVAIKPVTENFNTSTFNKIQEAIKLDPPLAPNLQRKIKTYNAKVQLAELRFSGGRIQNMLVEFPKKGLPIQDEKLKELLQSRIKLINNADFLKENNSIKTLQEEVEALRKKFLISLTSREGKSIIKKEEMIAFEKELNDLQEKIKAANEALPGILIKAMQDTKDLVISNLKTFFAAYPTKEQLKFPKPEVREYQINTDINKIVSSIRFPSLSKLTNHFSLKVNFYDLTWKDFKDNELLEEFEKKKILSTSDIAEIVEMKDAVEVKK